MEGIIPTILEDKRKIEAVLFNDSEGSQYKVGEPFCKRIEAYGEPSIYCLFPWIAIIDYQDEVVSRIPAHMVQIVYEDEHAE